MLTRESRDEMAHRWRSISNPSSRLTRPSFAFCASCLSIWKYISMSVWLCVRVYVWNSFVGLYWRTKLQSHESCAAHLASSPTLPNSDLQSFSARQIATAGPTRGCLLAVATHYFVLLDRDDFRSERLSPSRCMTRAKRKIGVRMCMWVLHWINMVCSVGREKERGFRPEHPIWWQGRCTFATTNFTRRICMNFLRPTTGPSCLRVVHKDRNDSNSGLGSPYYKANLLGLVLGSIEADFESE